MEKIRGEGIVVCSSDKSRLKKILQARKLKKKNSKILKKSLSKEVRDLRNPKATRQII